MKIVVNFLKKMALVSGLYSVVGFVAFLGLFGYVAASKTMSKIESEIMSTSAFIQSTYAQGDLVTLRTHLSSLSANRSWGTGYFENVDGERIWEKSGQTESKIAKNGLAYRIAWFIFKMFSSANFDSFPYVVKSVEIRSWSNQMVGVFSVKFDIGDDLLDYVNWIIAMAILFMAYWGVYLGLAYRTATRSFQPVNALSGLMMARAKEVGLKFSDVTADSADELQQFYTHFDELANRWKDAAHQMIEAERLKAQIDVTRQVAHDIRSPLSALNMVSAALTDIHEDKRLLIRTATQRINDIANNLLKQSREKASGAEPSNTTPQAPSEIDPIMLSPIVDAIVSEKRVQIRTVPRVAIEVFYNESYGIFSRVNSTEFSRVLSNLLNNAIEATAGAGKIAVRIRGSDKNVTVSVFDNGKGMPQEILRRIGEKGLSFGKEGTASGSGLGLYHAKTTMEAAGGALKVESELGRGTMVTLTLPRAQPPSWFQQDIQVYSDTLVVSVDDDLSIHQIWQKRVDDLVAIDAKTKPALLNFSSTGDLEAWFSKNPKARAIFLVDYGFLDESVNGLDLIEKLGIQAASVLVTSRFDEPVVMQRAREMGVRIIPKGLAPCVPITCGGE